MLFDLDDFKPINDTFGHAEGDRTLVVFANIMRDIFGDSDVFGRLGGDDFVALSTNIDGVQIDATMGRLQSTLNEYNQSSQHGYELKYSAGHISNPAGVNVSIEQLLEQADKLMYAQKQQRKNA